MHTPNRSPNPSAHAPIADKDLALLIFDLFFAGSETTYSTLTFAMYYLAAFPEAQRKLQEEIDRALPGDVLPTLEDRARWVMGLLVLGYACRSHVGIMIILLHVCVCVSVSMCVCATADT